MTLEKALDSAKCVYNNWAKVEKKNEKIVETK